MMFMNFFNAFFEGLSKFFIQTSSDHGLFEKIIGGQKEGATSPKGGDAKRVRNAKDLWKNCVRAARNCDMIFWKFLKLLSRCYSQWRERQNTDMSLENICEALAWFPLGTRPNLPGWKFWITTAMGQSNCLNFSAVRISQIPSGYLFKKTQSFWLGKRP